MADGATRTIVAGATRSPDFPATLGALDESYGGSFDVFVAALSADGTQLQGSTFIGGTGDDRAWAVALDSMGNPVVAGITSGEAFPTTAGAWDDALDGVTDAFVARLAADGSALDYATYLGGGAEDRAEDVATRLEGEGSRAPA